MSSARDRPTLEVTTRGGVNDLRADTNFVSSTDIFNGIVPWSPTVELLVVGVVTPPPTDMDVVIPPPILVGVVTPPPTDTLSLVDATASTMNPSHTSERYNLDN